MRCPICNTWRNYESALIEHIIDKHFHKPRGKFVGELMIDDKLQRCFNYSLICWCGWDAFREMTPPFIKSDFSMATIVAALHLERCGGPRDHWLAWRVEHMTIKLPPRLRGASRSIEFTAEGRTKNNVSFL